MKIEQAIAEMWKGRSARRLVWPKDLRTHIGSGVIRVFKAKGEDQPYLADSSDLLADDWEVFAVTVPFEKALVALKAGKKIQRKSWCSGFLEIRGNRLLYIDEEPRQPPHFSPWHIEVDDTLASDWVILD